MSTKKHKVTTNWIQSLKQIYFILISDFSYYGTIKALLFLHDNSIGAPIFPIQVLNNVFTDKLWKTTSAFLKTRKFNKTHNSSLHNLSVKTLLKIHLWNDCNKKNC